MTATDGSRDTAELDPDKIRAVRLKLLGTLATRLEAVLEAIYRGNRPAGAYLPDAEQSGMRALKNGALSVLTVGARPLGAQLARDQYESATNMTDRYAALAAVVAGWTADAEALLGNFRTMFTADRDPWSATWF